MVGKLGFQIVLFMCVVCPGFTQDFVTRDHLLRDWWGARSAWEEHGLTSDLVYTAEFFANTDGGMETGEEYRGDFSVTLELDTSAAGWWENGTFFVHLQEQHGKGVTDDYVGDFQVLSNIDADDYAQISEIWYRHILFDDLLWIKLGKMEANEDFAFVDFGGEFINSSAGFSPTIPLVTYPDQDWGAVLGVEPVDWFSMNMGAYQGRPDGGRSIGDTLDNLYGPLVLVEPAFHYSLVDQPGHFRVGGWWNGDEFEKFDGSDANENYGWYLTWDQEIWKENPDDECEQGIGLFGQYGWGDEDRNEAEHYIGGGIQWTGALPSRDDDVVGLGVFHVEFSDEAGFDEDGETAFELFYGARVAGWLCIKPDLQYIANPGGTDNDDAFAVGVRCEIVF